MVMKSGCVYMVDLGSPYGHVQAGVRPALLIQSTRLTRRISTATVVPITSSPSALSDKFSTNIDVPLSEAIKSESVALTQQIITIDKRKVTRFLGELDEDTVKAIKERIKINMGLQ